MKQRTSRLRLAATSVAATIGMTSLGLLGFSSPAAAARAVNCNGPDAGTYMEIYNYNYSNKHCFADGAADSLQVYIDGVNEVCGGNNAGYIAARDPRWNWELRNVDFRRWECLPMQNAVVTAVKIH